METLGTRLKALRTQHGMSQEDLAKMLDVSRISVVNWEQDSSRPKRLYEIAKIFHVTPEYLLHGEVNQQPVAPEEDGLRISRQERIMLERYRRLTPTRKQTIDNMLLNLDRAQVFDSLPKDLTACTPNNIGADFKDAEGNYYELKEYCGKPILVRIPMDNYIPPEMA